MLILRRFFNEILLLISGVRLKNLFSISAFKSELRLLTKLKTCKKKVSEEPHNPIPHFQLANVYSREKQWLHSIAEYRTCMALGKSNSNITLSLARSYLEIGQIHRAVSLCNNILKQANSGNIDRKAKDILSMAKLRKFQPLTNINHNQYYRLKTLADHLLSLFPNGNFSVLDVGGGNGELSLFIPNADYVIADPNINGISGIDLPFSDNTFDVVVACHVLEHIHFNDRQKFLYQLCCKAKLKVLLLNPFFNPLSNEKERLKIIVELTDASWAKEHLVCEFPKINEVEKFAIDHGFGFKVWPNGSLITTLAMVFVDHFAKMSGCTSELTTIHQFYNTRLMAHLSNAKLPTAYLVEIDIRRT
jgi:SAM-dependent methyltransferase